MASEQIEKLTGRALDGQYWDLGSGGQWIHRSGTFVPLGIAFSFQLTTKQIEEEYYLGRNRTVVR